MRWQKEGVEQLKAGGVAPECIALDPGICFGKKRRHNLALLKGVDLVLALGHPVCIGVSRKGFFSRMQRQRDFEDLVYGNIGTVLSQCRRGVQIVRVHDVRAVRIALDAFLAVEPECELVPTPGALPLPLRCTLLVS